jgi:flagellar biosynthesis/type III secretory pathway chaperone
MTADAHALRENLQEQIACAARLEQILMREKDVLISADLLILEQLCAEKSAQAETLQLLNRKLFRHFDISDASSFESRLRAQHPGLLPQWDELLQLAARCQRHNLENGALLIERRARVLSMLQVIHGRERPLYGRQGISDGDGGGRALASA